MTSRDDLRRMFFWVIESIGKDGMTNFKNLDITEADFVRGILYINVLDSIYLDSSYDLEHVVKTVKLGFDTIGVEDTPEFTTLYEAYMAEINVEPFDYNDEDIPF